MGLRQDYKDWIRNRSGIQGVSYSHNIAARSGSHYCPKCRVLLDVVKKTRVVNSESEEAKDFSFDKTEGNMKFTWDVFFCPKCESEIDAAHLLWHEKEQKKLGKKGNPQYLPSQSFYEATAYDGTKKLVYRYADKYKKANRLWQVLVAIGIAVGYFAIYYLRHSAQ